MTPNLSLVIWDWNGTLCDDVDLCVANFNDIITRRGLQPITKERFRELYGHPVQAMYNEVGVNFDDTYTFTQLSDEWYHGYITRFSEAKLFGSAIPLLRTFQRYGVRQVLVSALEHPVLMEQVNGFGIEGYFELISGHHDREAESKIARGVNVWKQLGMPTAKTLLIGDSDHDLALAAAIGCRACLIDSGHQSLAKLQNRQEKEAHVNGPLFVHSLSEITEQFLSESF